MKTVNAHISSAVNRKQKFLPAACRTPRFGPNRKPQTHSIHGPLNGLKDMASFSFFYLSHIGFHYQKFPIFRSRYSRMVQVKFVEDNLQKILSDMVCSGRPYRFSFFKGCLPQIFPGPFLNTLTHLLKIIEIRKLKTF